MAVTAIPYGGLTVAMVSGVFDYMGADIGCALTTNLYTPVRDSHNYLDDITAELTDVSYARELLMGKAQTYSSGTHTLTLQANDVVFPNLVSTDIRFVIFYQTGLSDATSPLIGYWDLGANYNANVNNFEVILDAAGFLTVDL
jgi:hypothetical protein